MIARTRTVTIIAAGCFHRVSPAYRRGMSSRIPDLWETVGPRSPRGSGRHEGSEAGDDVLAGGGRAAEVDAGHRSDPLRQPARLDPVVLAVVVE
ncbi:hypothetical protein GCM10027161_25140 [Microbispora hainanensis]